VLIRVGASRKEYHVHEHLLRSNSVFFDLALKKNWREGQERIVTIEETDTDALKVWSKWPYTREVFPAEVDHARTDESNVRYREWQAR
jgi:hypothetical protein